MRVALLYLTSVWHSQKYNQISSLEGVVFPAGLTALDLVSICLCFFCGCEDVMCEAVAVSMVCDYVCCGVVSDVCMPCAVEQRNQQP
jgi:hypothetical protein